MATVTGSLRRLWAWINHKSIAPWVLVILGAVYGFAKWETTLSAQSAQVQELKQDTTKSIDDVKAQVQRDHDDLHQDLIERLDDLKDAQKAMDHKIDDVRRDMDSVKDRVRDLSPRRR